MIKPYKLADEEFSPSRNSSPLTVPPVEEKEDKKINRVIKERRLRGKNKIKYPVRYTNQVHEEEWLAESDKISRRFRPEYSYK
ncbi:hypothetical protein O181_000710 [Austropuccinia psidii MF-1]|uniref:Uncharacterized protein n=1 Tax=Austropuccinia psidii MF-1 TaxID=1389203 RepID=A0A9Q3B9J3_9BASI|nr:hypothetical protein [Austropuccinia psidii MF-1]